jgi:hypothetical protein
MRLPVPLQPVYSRIMTFNSEAIVHGLLSTALTLMPAAYFYVVRAPQMGTAAPSVLPPASWPFVNISVWILLCQLRSWRLGRGQKIQVRAVFASQPEVTGKCCVLQDHGTVQQVQTATQIRACPFLPAMCCLWHCNPRTSRPRYFHLACAHMCLLVAPGAWSVRPACHRHAEKHVGPSSHVCQRGVLCGPARVALRCAQLG